MFSRRTNRAQPASPAAEPSRACSALDTYPEASSVLTAELMAIYRHTRPLGALSQEFEAPEEYRLIARSIVQHLLEGWRNQTEGRGTIRDLLEEDPCRMHPQPC